MVSHINIEHSNIEHSRSVHSSPDRAIWIGALAGYTVLCSWARHFTLTASLLTQGRVVRKPVNVNPGLNVN